MKICLNNVSKTMVDKKKRQAVFVLYNVNAEFLDGKINVVLGESGAGKTFLLKVIAGLEAIDEGEIIFDGIDVTKNAAGKRNASYLSQNYALYPHLTVFDNVAYPLKLQGIEADEIRKRVKETLNELNIAHLSTRRPKELSGGEAQRVAIARAIVKRPELILLDEPLSNLDEALRPSFLALIKEIKQKYSTTIIYVTHNLNEAYTLSDALYIMSNGEIVETGDINALFKDQSSFFYQNFIKQKEQ